MPSLRDWLQASWNDFLRRWPTLMIVAGAGGAAALLGAAVPLAAAGGAVMMGAPSGTAFGLGTSVSMAVGLWLSTWGQAAVLRAAVLEEGASDVLSRSWDMTPAFCWVATLLILASGGGFLLLVIPGLLVGTLLFFAPVYQMSGEAEGLRALELSWARVRPRLGETALRLSLAGLLALAPGWIPYLGWLIAPLWAPFGVVAAARLARDLRDASPGVRTPNLASLTAGLSLVCLLGLGLSCWVGFRAYAKLREAAFSGRLFASRLDAQTADALIAVLKGDAGEAQTRRAFSFIIEQSSAAFSTP